LCQRRCLQRRRRPGVAGDRRRAGFYSCRAGCRTSISRRSSTNVVLDKAVTICPRRSSRREIKSLLLVLPTPMINRWFGLPRAKCECRNPNLC
jgi:hypothetical protein